MTCTDRWLSHTSSCRLVRAVRRFDGEGYIALALLGCPGGNVRGLVIVLAVAEGVDLSNAVGDLYSTAFAKHMLPWEAITWVYRSAAGNFYQLAIEANPGGVSALRRESLRNNDCYDLIQFLERAGFSLCREGRALIEAALQAASRGGL